MRAARYIATQADGQHASAETLRGARQLLAFLVQRSSKDLNWSSTEFAEVASLPWVPAVDWTDRAFPPDNCMTLVGASANVSTSEESEDSQRDKHRGAPEVQDSDEDEGPGVEGLSTSEIRARICEVYRKHNPQKLQEVGALLFKYRGKELSLYKAMLKKYKVVGEEFFAD
eukprot:COSAG05_NODE_6671_length_922_cov_1.687728_1_plen_170_part_10